MNVNKLRQQLAKEMKRNPKKAVLLGLLLAVAGWFWLPLVVGSARDEAAEADTLVAEVAPPPLQSVDAKPAAAATRATWQQLLQWMEGDTRLKPGHEPSLARDPFAAIVTPEQKQAPTVKPAAKLPATPERLGLRLTGTLIGTRRVATIGGRTYREGQVINGKDEVSFVVEKITAKGVTLRRDAQTYELKISSANGDTVEITRVGEVSK